jgi:hypothetical protein
MGQASRQRHQGRQRCWSARQSCAVGGPKTSPKFYSFEDDPLWCKWTWDPVAKSLDWDEIVLHRLIEAPQWKFRYGIAVGIEEF